MKTLDGLAASTVSQDVDVLGLLTGNNYLRRDKFQTVNDVATLLIEVVDGVVVVLVVCRVS